ncbi:MAG: MBL fold metallo-hydrolase [Lachnospiraceae bacterium]|nr:MBL fold metallo-hydrolase [Lachnospiraceae bacterium]
MKLTFLGAAHEVTGSCHMLEACGKVMLVDYGMEQGEDIYENQEIPVNAADIDYVFLTHAHIDHSGLLPLLYKRGFRGTIFSTYATQDLCGIMLRDSAHIQMFEAEWRNRKARRSGKEEYVPLYDMEAADKVMKHFCGCEYGVRIRVTDEIRIRFTDIGHLLGSACIEIWLTEGEETKKIVFSGDIGNLNQPILKDPQTVDQADYLVIESTYGDRSHGERPDYVEALTGILQETFDRGGNVVIPAFAVGRTQEMLYFLREIKAKGLVKGHEDFKVFVDSPLAVQATTIFNKNMYDCFDEETMSLVHSGINPISFPGLSLSITSDESKAINFDESPKVILSASGMCEAGRIRHHLKHNLWREESTILFVGYQSKGTLGRAIVEGANEVRLFGETVEIRAHIKVLAGVSGHADKQGLISWLQGFYFKPGKVFIVHGEDTVCDQFAQCLQEEYDYIAEAPYSGASYDLITDTCLATGNMKRITKDKKLAKPAAAVYDRLVEAGKRLMRLIEKSRGFANKDLAKLADQIQAICDKWERK